MLKKKNRGWYTISVDTLRGFGVLILLAVAATGGWYLYRRWELGELQREAGRLIEEVASQLERAGNDAAGSTPSNEYREARTSYESARESYDEGDFRGSVVQGRRARLLLGAMLDPGGRVGSGEAQFIAVQGSVEFRRGERGAWEAARGRDLLYSGDYVKSAANGSAEIVFVGGTLYTVRPNTLFLVTRTQRAIGAGTEQAIAMEYGWLDLNTARQPGRVSTPSAETRFGRDTEGAVSFDKATETARYSASRGEIEVTTLAGVTKTVGALEEIRQKGELLTDPRALPAAPTIVAPAAHLETSLDSSRRLVLSWQPVPTATRYALQVSRNRLFVDNLIDVESRRKLEATLELRGEGTFQWRLAAVSRDGLQGPWTEPRSFRVSGEVRAGEIGDKTPPPIELDQLQVYGNLFIVNGRTEPDASMRINGEDVGVALNGTFTKTLLVAREGWSVLDLEAADPAGNIAKLRQRVFVETL